MPHKVIFRPYFEVGGGIVSAVSNPGFDAERYASGGRCLIAGHYIRLTDTVDGRLFDYGATAFASNSATTVSVGFLDAGLVYHFHPAAKHH